jgi:hypothetical protein
MAILRLTPEYLSKFINKSDLMTEVIINNELNNRIINCNKNNKFDYYYQKIKNITIIRDDFLCGGTKSRILHFIPEKYTEYVYLSNPYGGAGLALATKFGNKVTVFVNEPKLGPLSRMAIKLGAKYYYVNDNNIVYKYVNENKSRFLIPNGINLPGVIEYFTFLGNDIANKLGTFDIAFIPCGSGTLTRGLSRSKLATTYIAISLAKYKNKNDLNKITQCESIGKAKCFIHYQSVNEPVLFEYKPPFLSTMYYDAKVWQYAKEYADLHPNKKVLLWNVL